MILRNNFKTMYKVSSSVETAPELEDKNLVTLAQNMAISEIHSESINLQDSKECC